MFSFAKLLVVLSLPQIKGNNIMIGKPVKQSTTYSGRHASKANDGDFKTNSHTTAHVPPYWQGDLQGFFRVSHIKVTSGNDLLLRNASIGLSLLDVTCPGSDVIKCGQWPNAYLPKKTLTFDCNQTARFIRISKDVAESLSLMEVQVFGVPERKINSGMKYVSIKSNKLAAPITARTVSMVTECATLCYKTQPCLAFSFRKGGQLNCLLGTVTGLTQETDWVTNTVKDCFKPPICRDAIYPTN